MSDMPAAQSATRDLEARLVSPVAQWLGFEKTDRPDVFRLRYDQRHIGNPFIRALHGGTLATFIEFSAEVAVAGKVEAPTELISAAIDYIRVTKDVDAYARVETIRFGRRIAFVDVWCWQDDENMPVARGSCSLRIL